MWSIFNVTNKANEPIILFSPIMQYLKQTVSRLFLSKIPALFKVHAIAEVEERTVRHLVVATEETAAEL